MYYIYYMSSNKKMCPVPFDQQPLNEYEALKKSFIFSWSTENLQTFSSKLIILFSLISLICIIVNLLIVTIIKFSTSTVISIFLFSGLIVEIVLIRLYLGWSYILKRLSSATVFYEESGWYDGQLWIKSADLLTQDRLVGIYQVEPLLERIKKIFIVNSIFLIILLLLLEIF